MLIVAGFALLALALGAVGVYGVMAHLVTQRTREIGIRIALGAVPREILSLVLSQGVRLAVIGIAVGLLGALAASRLLTRLLFQTAPTDTATFVSTAGRAGAGGGRGLADSGGARGADRSGGRPSDGVTMRVLTRYLSG